MSIPVSTVRSSTGVVVGAGTVPVVAALETNFYGLQVAQGQTFAGKVTLTVPPDYDSSIDELRIRIAANRGDDTAGDATKTLKATIYRKRPVPSIIPDDAQGILPAGLALSADLGVVSTSAVIPGLGSNLATTWLEINADAFTGTVAPELGQGTSNRSLSATADASIHPGDCLDINLALNSATGTDAVNIYGIEIWYRSNLAFSDINSR
jgi:hypothetical protein